MINGFPIVEVRNSPNMLGEWKEKERKLFEKAVKLLFLNKTLKDHRETNHKITNFTQIENFFGFPYTTTSSFAMVSNCNTVFKFQEDFNFDCLGIGEDGNVYLFCTNNEQKEKIYKVII
jgi:hypothetical protein